MAIPAPASLRQPRPAPPPKPKHLSLRSFPDNLSFSRPPSVATEDAVTQAWEAELRAHFGRPVSVVRHEPSEEAPQGKARQDEAQEEEEEVEVLDGEADAGAEGVGEGREARALFDFQGEAQWRELTVSAGESFHILTEDVAEGWSLAVTSSTIGLIPRTYYTFITDFSLTPFPPPLSPSLASPPPRTPTSPSSSAPPIPSGTHRPSSVLDTLRAGSFLGGYGGGGLTDRSLNRFSAYVKSGAEEWVVAGAPAPPVPRAHVRAVSEEKDGEEEEEGEKSFDGVSEEDRHYIDPGPRWRPKTPLFHVRVHSPEKRTQFSLSGLSEYTLYALTSMFPSPEADAPGATLTVWRRFSEFTMLSRLLAAKFAGLALPVLPEKVYQGRFDKEFVEARRRDLEVWVNAVVRHPILRYNDGVLAFLGEEDDTAWRKLSHIFSNPTAAGPAFFANVWHPSYNVDVDEATEEVERFERHLKGVGKGMRHLREVVPKHRQAMLETSNQYRNLSYHLLSLYTGQPVGGAGATTPDPASGAGAEDAAVGGPRAAQNGQGAWSWREESPEALRLTGSLQATVEALQEVADAYDANARTTLFETAERVKNLAYPHLVYAGTIETHRSTLAKYKEALDAGDEDEDGDENAPTTKLTQEELDALAARAESVLNVTMAEVDRFHSEKTADFEALAVGYLDGQIEHYENVLSHLRTARQAFVSPPSQPPSSPTLLPRQPSKYERELAHPRVPALALPQPASHVLDSVVARPISVVGDAVVEGLGSLWRPLSGIVGSGGGACAPAALTGSVGSTSSAGSGGKEGMARASVFGRLW